MKKLLLVIVCLLSAAVGFCQQRRDVYYLSETEESIQLSVMVYDVKKKEAVNAASYTAIQTLLFDGIPGSIRCKIPYVTDEYGSQSVHAGYYRNLFENGGYGAFVIAGAIVEKGRRKTTGKKVKFYVVDVNINLKALKYSLTENNIIRRFGVR